MTAYQLLWRFHKYIKYWITDKKYSMSKNGCAMIKWIKLNSVYLIIILYPFHLNSVCVIISISILFVWLYPFQSHCIRIRHNYFYSIPLGYNSTNHTFYVETIPMYNQQYKNVNNNITKAFDIPHFYYNIIFISCFIYCSYFSNKLSVYEWMSLLVHNMFL